MASKPCALLKDLRSTGYFYDELKTFSSSPEMDISTYCTGFAIPYLLKLSDSYEKLGQADRSIIFKLAVKYLSEVGGEDLIDSVFGLKKVAVSELDKLAKANLKDELDRTESLSIHRKLESTKSLIKLLVNIIKIFKLTEITTKQRQSEGISDAVGDAIMQNWKVQNCPASEGGLSTRTE
jgi:hypothetical protein